jgi:non-heme Fe2+,alpha-ketoglutarate-dependent halogenase
MEQATRSLKVLSPAQRDGYFQHGFAYPFDALSSTEVVERQRDFERFETRLGKQLTQAEMKWRAAPYTFLPWMDALVRHPRILDAVEDVIGPDILVFHTTVFVKEPGTPAFTAWHQDATYFGLAPYEHITAWLALTDASRLAGCMEMLSFNGAPRQYRHSPAKLANSLNSAGQVIDEPLDESDTVFMELRAGQFSLHHTLSPHRSPPNNAAHRRIGLGISYIPAHCKSTGSYRLPALLVRGRDHGNFELLPGAPKEEFSPEGLAVHDDFYRRLRENGAEQQRLHDSQFSAAA